MGEEKEKQGCVQPARGPLVEEAVAEGDAPAERAEEVREMVTARVGREAIDFEANAYVEGEGFRTVRLSEFKGKWIVLCFYPGDFTFV